jgi:hypothetical protein
MRSFALKKAKKTVFTHIKTTQTKHDFAAHCFGENPDDVEACFGAVFVLFLSLFGAVACRTATRETPM